MQPCSFLAPGIVLGPFLGPRIIPAAIVEGLCAAALVWGALAIFERRTHVWRAGLIANLVALVEPLVCLHC